MTTSTRIKVDLVDGRVRHTDLVKGSYLSARPLRAKGDMARVALVGAYAMLLGGDDVRIEVAVGPGVRLELVEPSGTVAYNADGDQQRWETRVQVAEGASLIWRAAPFVVTAGANVRRRLGVDLAEGGSALLHETLVLGRHYERRGGPLYATTRVSYGRRPLLIEDLDLRDAALTGSPGIMGDHRVMASAMLLGQRPAGTETPHETMLHGPGAIARALTPQAHQAESAIAPSWNRWRERLAEPTGPRTNAIVAAA